MLGSIRVWAFEKVLGIVTPGMECSLYFFPLQLCWRGAGGEVNYQTGRRPIANPPLRPAPLPAVRCVFVALQWCAARVR